MSLLLDKPQPGEKETVVYAEGEDVLARFDLTGATVEVHDGVTVVIFSDGAVIEIVGLEDITLLGDISPEAGEQPNSPNQVGNNGHGTSQDGLGGIGGGGIGGGLGGLGSLDYTELAIGASPFSVGQQQFLLPIIPPTPGLGSIVSVFASVVAPSEANPLEDENELVDDPDTTISFVVNLSQPSNVPVVVSFVVVPGSAQAGDAASHEGDFSGPLNGTLTFAPGETIKTITLNIVDDFTFEPSESFTIQLSSPVNAVLGNGGQGAGVAVGTIVDNDPVPELVFVDGSVAATEGQSISFVLTLSNPSFETVIVSLEAKDGTATEGIDFGELTGQKVTFLPGQTTTQVSVVAIEDDVFEGEESFTLALKSESGDASTDAEIVVTIGDASPEPTLLISNAEASEGDIMTVALSLSNPSAETVVVRLSAIGGEAEEGADFQILDGGLVTFSPGQTQASASITILEDGLFEGNEQFAVGVTTISGQVSTGDTGTATIQDGDAAPKVSISDTTVTEGGVASFVVSLSGPVDQDVVLSFATTDGSAKASSAGAGTPDYTAQTGTVTILAGQSSATATINVPTANDTVSEQTETFAVNLTPLSGPIAASGNDLQGVATILDNDDAPKVSISDVAVTEGSVASFTVTLSQPSDQNVVLSFATADGNAKSAAGGAGTPDYTAQTGTVTILAGQTSATATINVPTTNDNVSEQSETFTVNLSPQSGPISATGNDLQGTATILDNDDAPKVSINDVTVTEGNVASFSVTLSRATDQNVILSFTTQDGSAKDGTGESGAGIPDYTAQTGTVTILAGQTSATATIVVPITNDGTFEQTETFNVVLAPQAGTIASSGNDLTGKGTILDNDPPPKLLIGNDSAIEGDPLFFQLSLSTSSLATIVVSLQTGGGSAIESPLENADYLSADTPNPTLVTFLPGETAKSIEITTIEDLTEEAPEFFTVSANLVSGNADLGDTGSATIFDDDIKKDPPGEALSVTGLASDDSSAEADDTFLWDPDDSPVDGGDGTDTLIVGDGADLNAVPDLDERVESIEVVSLAEAAPGGSGLGTALRLDAQDVLEITDQAGPEVSLTVLGSPGDTVELVGGDWGDPTEDGEFHVFSQAFGNTVVTVRIDDDIALGDVKAG